MAEFEVKFKGDSKWLYGWSLHFEDGNDMQGLQNNHQHVRKIVDSAFEAFCSYYQTPKKEDEQNVPISSGSSPNPN